jgi:predicted GNAT family acetyltransferase
MSQDQEHVDQAPTSPEPPIENNVAEHRFETHVGDAIAELQYRYLHNGALVLVHTEVPPALAGHGIGARLVRTALEFARANGLMVVPHCPFAAAYIKAHAEYASLVRH